MLTVQISFFAWITILLKNYCFLALKAIYPVLVHTIFMALSWNDSMTCTKALNWCVPVLKQVRKYHL